MLRAKKGTEPSKEEYLRLSSTWRTLNRFTDFLVGEVEDNIFGCGQGEYALQLKTAQANGTLASGYPKTHPRETTKALPLWAQFPGVAKSRFNAPVKAENTATQTMGKRKALVDPDSKKRKRTEIEADVTEQQMLDLWGAEGPDSVRPNNKKHGGGKQERIEKTEALRRANVIPDSAQSYNPVPQDHAAAVAAAEAKLLRKEALLANNVLRARVDFAVKKGVKGDDFAGTDWQETITGEAGEHTSTKRKTRVQRNRTKRLIVEAELLNRKKQANKVVRDADRIDALLEEITAEKEKGIAKNKVRRDLAKNKESLRVGRKRYKAPAMDLQTSDDIVASMRGQGRVTASMRDPIKLRYEAFQKRSIIPAQTALKRRKPKRQAKYFLVSKRET